MTDRATILDHIGNTPLLKLNHVTDGLDVDIYVKCEFTNPGGSIKDRMALRMIEEAERRGDLEPGGTIVDQSTGNTGPALSFVGAVKGYKVRLFLPAQLSSAYDPADRIRIARLYGCEVTPIDLDELVEDADSLEGIERAAAFVAIRMKQCHDLAEKDPSAWWANQLGNVDNTASHRDGTGVEILDQMDGSIDGWIASVGTGGTLLGVAETLKQHHPDMRVVGVLPTDDLRIEWVRSRARPSRLGGVWRARLAISHGGSTRKQSHGLRGDDRERRRQAHGRQVGSRRGSVLRHVVGSQRHRGDRDGEDDGARIKNSDGDRRQA